MLLFLVSSDGLGDIFPSGTVPNMYHNVKWQFYYISPKEGQYTRLPAKL